VKCGILSRSSFSLISFIRPRFQRYWLNGPLDIENA